MFAIKSEKNMTGSTISHPSLSIVGLIWRSLVVGLIYVITFMVTPSLGSLIGVAFDVPTGVDPTIGLLSMFVGGTLIGLVTGPISTKLTLPRAQRIGVLFLVLFMWAFGINAVDTFLFTTYSIPFQAFLIIMNLIVNLVLGISIGVLFPPMQTGTGFTAEVKSYFSQRRGKSWLWRFALAAVLFYPIYMFFGLVFSPLTVPYYNMPELGLGLVIPNVLSPVFISIEIGRGLAYALIAVPLLAVLRMPKWRLGLWMGLILAIVGGVVLMLLQWAWPLPLRLGHGVEIVCDSFAQGLMMAWLLWSEK
ncbi:MAG: hypothetical protein NWE79_04600 [Candidatus Bathyarchaeota archaeon]|nr:hypothetical protein [Candidatus Bathyarchaeota archaeon]